MRKIPVFVSCPTSLSPEQEAKRETIIEILDSLDMEPRALGREDYPMELPLKEVFIIAKHCAGGIILGFEQIKIISGIKKRGVPGEEKTIGENDNACMPTPWNQLEAGILFGLKLPLLIFREAGVSGGVFDNGVSDVFIHNMPPGNVTPNKKSELRNVFLKWYGAVSSKYHEF